MRFLRVGRPGVERPVVCDDVGTSFDLSPLTPDVDGDFFANDGIDRTRQAMADGALDRVDVTGMNYAAHAAESGSAPPAQPVLFFKTPNTVVGPYDEVLIPRGSTKTDWEVELAVIVGRRAAYLDSPADAASHIAGYTISNDVSERAFQLEQSGGQWSKGKCCATFNPLGPAVVPADEVDVTSLRLRSWVNGEPRQDSSTADLIFAVDYLVWHLSQFAVLEPGDIINTGTPEGVALSGRFPYLTPGDVMEMSIDGLGTQRQQLRQAQ